MQKVVNRCSDVRERVVSLQAAYLEFEHWFLSEFHYSRLSKRDTLILKSISLSLFNIVNVYGKVR